MTLDRLDLNLLRVFEAVYLERHVTRAGHRLGMEQASVSNALARLRVALGDELFVRTAEGMEPTERAHAMAGAVVQALAGLREAMAPAEAFQPGAARGVVDIGVSALAELTLGGELRGRLLAEAPGLFPRFHPVSTADVPGLLMDGGLLLAIVEAGDLPAHLNRLPLGRHDHGVLLRRDHPGLAGTWNLDRYLALDHLRITAPLSGPVGKPPPGEGAGVDAAVDRALAILDRPRRTRATMAHALSAAQLVAGSDLCWTLAGPLAEVLADGFGLCRLPVPFDLPPVETSLCWHRRHDGDGRHVWLRRLVAEVARSGG